MIIILIFTVLLSVGSLGAASSEDWCDFAEYPVRLLDPFVVASCIEVSSPFAAMPHKLAFRAIEHRRVLGCLVAGYEVNTSYKTDVACELVRLMFLNRSLRLCDSSPLQTADIVGVIRGAAANPSCAKLIDDIKQGKIFPGFFCISRFGVQTYFVRLHEVAEMPAHTKIADQYQYIVDRDFKVHFRPSSFKEQAPSKDHKGSVLTIKINAKVMLDHLKRDNRSDDF